MLRHRLDAGVEERHAAARLLDEVDVHRPVREAAAHDPDTVGGDLHRDRRRTAADLLLTLHAADHTGRGVAHSPDAAGASARRGHAAGATRADSALAREGSRTT